MAIKQTQTHDQPDELNDRARSLLKTLVEQYIKDGQPVGSKTLARDTALDVSSATIRSVMAELEKLGMVKSPHTSAGRIPTDMGYRVFVDSLITVKSPTANEIEKLWAGLEEKKTVDELMDSVSSALSEVTKMAGVVMVPQHDYRSLRRIEFLPLSEKQVLAILVINEKEIQNSIIDTEREYSASELQEAANYLNALFGGKDLLGVRVALLDEMRRTKEQMNDMMQRAIEMAGKVFTQEENEQDFVLAGQTNLMKYNEFSNVDSLRKLFDAFSQKRDVLHLLDNCLMAQSMRIFIGTESGYHVFDDCSIVTSPYEVDGQTLGVLGVIGPTRMAYERVIPLVDVTSKMLGNLLNSRE